MPDDAPSMPHERRPGVVDARVAAYPPQLAAVRQARHFVESSVRSAGLPEQADEAGSLVSELAANAVLHARTDFDVHVQVTDDGVRVEVHDRSAVPPTFTVPSATAMGGRGLVMVQSVATRWGSESVKGGKSVWFEVRIDSPTPQAMEVEVSVEELMALWADHSSSPSLTGDVDTLYEITVADLPAAELLAAKEQMDDLLRELQLVLLAMGGHPRSPGPTPPEVDVARRLDEAARGFAAGRRQVKEQVMRAVVLGRSRVDVHLVLPASTAHRAVAYREAVLAAEQIGHTGSLLTVVDDLSQHAVVRHHYLDELIRQLPQA